MDEYVAKPIRADHLFAAIEAVLAQSAGPRAPRRAPCTHGRGRRPACPLPQGGGVDWPETLRSVQDDPALLATIVETAVEEIPRLTASIERAVAGGDSADLRLFGACAQGVVALFRRRRPSRKPSAWSKWGAKAICAARPRPCGCSMRKRKRSSAA